MQATACDDGLLLLGKQVAVGALHRVLGDEPLQLGSGTRGLGGMSGELVNMETVLLYLQLEALERTHRLPVTRLDIHAVPP
jgi:hypothetical protein